MIKPFALALMLISLTGCDVLLDEILNPEPDLCRSNEIPETPEGATAADVEREIVEMCRDRDYR